MKFFQFDGTLYRINSATGVVQRWQPEQRKWLLSDVAASRIRSLGKPAREVELR